MDISISSVSSKFGVSCTIAVNNEHVYFGNWVSDPQKTNGGYWLFFKNKCIIDSRFEDLTEFESYLKGIYDG